MERLHREEGWIAATAAVYSIVLIFRRAFLVKSPGNGTFIIDPLEMFAVRGNFNVLAKSPLDHGWSTLEGGDGRNAPVHQLWRRQCCGNMKKRS